MIDVLLFHDPNDATFIKEDPCYFENMSKENWPVNFLGVSAYEPCDVEQFNNIGLLSAYQFPYNLLDRRFERVKVPVGMRVGRSVFLQGVLASKNTIRQECPVEVREIQALYHRYLLRQGINPITASLSFVAKSAYADYFVIGVEKKEQLIEILEQLEKIENEVEINLNEILDEFTDVHLSYLDPRTWK